MIIIPYLAALAGVDYEIPFNSSTECGIILMFLMKNATLNTANSVLVDFHVHSTASDGTETPSDLARRGRLFCAMALTDHDNTSGVAEFLNAPHEPFGKHDARVCHRIAGVELSIEPGATFDKFHLLGLNVDPENAALKAFMQEVLAGRNARNEQILANFRHLGIEMEHPEDSVHSFTNGEVLARPHFARWLMQHGYAASITEAFDKYLLPDSPEETRCFVTRYHPNRERAFAAVHAAGGLAIMAHPKYWRKYWKDTKPEYAAAEHELAALKEMGLDGLEAHYEANTLEENLRFTEIADKLNLLKTAGSDFHGRNKPTISLGMREEVAFISPFLERIGAL